MIAAKVQAEEKQDFFDLFERPPKAMIDSRNTENAYRKDHFKTVATKETLSVSVNLAADRTAEQPQKQLCAPVVDQNNPLKSE